MRQDGIAHTLTEVNPSTHLNFDLASFEPIVGMFVLVRPSTWNDVEFRVNTLVEAAHLEAWALRWLDVHDTHNADGDGLQSVIHSLTVPIVDANESRFAIDLGSAPARAVEELLALLHSCGGSRVTISSSIVQ